MFWPERPKQRFDVFYVKLLGGTQKPLSNVDNYFMTLANNLRLFAKSVMETRQNPLYF